MNIHTGKQYFILFWIFLPPILHLSGFICWQKMMFEFKIYCTVFYCTVTETKGKAKGGSKEA
jgi:hypothetical protein